MNVNINTQEKSGTLPLSDPSHGIYGPLTWEQARAIGWRIMPELPSVADGYERGAMTYVEGDGITAQAVYTDTLIADRLAAEAAAEVIRKATPIIYDQPIQARIEIPVAPDHAYRLEVDTVSGEVIPVEIESVRLTEAEYATAHASKVLERVTHRNNITAIKTDLDQVATALDAIDVTNSGVLGVAIAATTGVTKTALGEVRTMLVDFKVAVKNLRQACEKVRKEIR